jgi:hypothetical protein
MKFKFFTLEKKNGKLIFKQSGIDRAVPTMWCIEESNKKYNWPDFKPMKIYTSDYEKNINDYTYSKKNSTYRTVPDFIFKNWSWVGIPEYDIFVKEIYAAGLTKPKLDKAGWMGSENHIVRTNMYNIGLQNKHDLEVKFMLWKNKPTHREPSDYISFPDLVKKYSILIDVEGNGYSGRLKHLLWSNRPVILIDRLHKEFFYDNLKPWEHYIPVKRDLSDLIEKIKWCKNNKKDAYKIAQNAYIFCNKYLTRDYVYRRWDEIIHDHIDND